MMKSPITGKKMDIQERESVLFFRNEAVAYNHIEYYCNKSGEAFTTTELDELNMKRVHDNYRNNQIHKR